MEILLLIIGLSIGSLITFFLLKMKIIKSKERYLRRGIINNEYDITTYGMKTGTLSVQFEIGEIERTDKKSKIKAININPNLSGYNSKSKKNELKLTIDNSWIKSSEIEWIETSIADNRNEKLDELLK